MEDLEAIFYLAISGLYIRFLLQSVGQSWIKTVAHTSTIMILPLITYVITNVISGNIALSLGMVGALSIVRFRNPVRSPLELSVYFGSITLGISAAVSVKWLSFLIISVTFIALLLIILQKIFKLITGKEFFITSFSEGNALSTLTVKVSENISELDNENFLVSKLADGNEITYTFASSNFNKLKEKEIDIRSSYNPSSIELNR